MNPSSARQRTRRNGPFPRSCLVAGRGVQIQELILSRSLTLPRGDPNPQTRQLQFPAVPELLGMPGFTELRN